MNRYIMNLERVRNPTAPRHPSVPISDLVNVNPNKSVPLFQTPLDFVLHPATARRLSADQHSCDRRSLEPLHDEFV